MFDKLYNEVKGELKMKKDLNKIFQKCYYEEISEYYFERAFKQLQLIMTSGYTYSVDSHDVWLFTRFYFLLKQDLEKTIDLLKANNNQDSLLNKCVNKNKHDEFEKIKEKFTLFEREFYGEFGFSINTIENMIEMEKEKFGDEI